MSGKGGLQHKIMIEFIVMVMVIISIVLLPINVQMRKVTMIMTRL